MPVVYTPVVALGCQEFSHIYRRARGLFIPYPLRDSIRTLLQHRPNQEVDVIVVTDGERILGIGDQGVGGLGIPIGKLSLYTLIGGIRPERTLPVVLDVGTNNLERLRDPEYLGWRHERVTGPDYEEFIDRFVLAVRQELPGTVLQWEDFGADHARPILEKYRDRALTFNDDIQGTGAVALGAILSALQVTGSPLSEQRIVIFGAGCSGGGGRRRDTSRFGAGRGRERRSPSPFLDGEPGRSPASGPRGPQARAAGLCPNVGRGRGMVEDRPETRQPGGGRPGGAPDDPDRALHIAGAFDEPLVREMGSAVERPIIFPLSNPTAKSEAVPEDLLRWTNGRAVIATGSPFQSVDFGTRRISIAQCNNVYIFPAVGLGVVANEAPSHHQRDHPRRGTRTRRESPHSVDPTAPPPSSDRDLRRTAVEDGNGGRAGSPEDRATHLRRPPRSSANGSFRRNGHRATRATANIKIPGANPPG